MQRRIEMVVADVVQLVQKRLLLHVRRKRRVHIDGLGAVRIRQSDAAHFGGQLDDTHGDVRSGHRVSSLRSASMIATARITSSLVAPFARENSIRISLRERSSVAYRRSATLKLLRELMGGKADEQ